MKMRMKNKKGQVLIIWLCAVVVVMLLIIMAVETGNLMYKKARIQNIADSGALEGGLWYARAMNIIALSNKVLAIAFGVGVVETVVGAPEAGIDTVHEVQNMQDMIAGTGSFSVVRPLPLFAEAMVLKNGALNGAVSIAVFNSQECDIGANLPSFNVKRRYADQALKDALDLKDDSDKFYYTSGSGEKVYVDKKYVTIDTRIKNRNGTAEQVMTKNDPVYGTKFLKREKSPDKGAVPLDIVESSAEHSVLVFSGLNDRGQLLKTFFLRDNNGGEIQPAMISAISYVEIGGGKLDIQELDGAGYAAKISRIKLPCLDAIPGLGDNAGGPVGNILNTIGGGVLLH
jgi:hypothetical protein